MRKVKLTKSQLSKALTETDGDEQLLGHPVGGSGGSEYDPQSMDQHKKTFRAFNKKSINEGGLQVDYDTFKSEVISFMKHLLERPMDHILPPFFEKLGVDKQQLIDEMADVGLITWYSPNGTVKYVAYKENMENKVDELFSRLSSDEAVLDEDEDHLSPEEPRGRDYKILHMNEEIGIFKKNKKAFVFHHNSTPKEEFEPYAEVPIKYTGFKDEEGFADYDKEDFDVDGDVIERYVNDNLYGFNFGYGLEGFSNSDDMVVITNKLKKQLYKMYPNDEELKQVLDGEGLQTEVTGAAGSSGSFETKLGGDDANNQMVRRTTQYDPSNQINENEGEMERSSEEKGTVEYQSEMRGEEPFDLNGKRYVYVWVKDADGESSMGVYCFDDESVQTFDDFYRDNFKDANESTGASGSSGAYVQPKVWADSPQDMRHGGQPWWPSGQIVNNPMKESEQKPMMPGGEFVEFDDCVRLNNNKEAQKGGCSQGAKDNVVKTKKGQGGVASDQGVYNEVAKRTGRSIEEVKDIIENKGSKA